ncbi:MAG: hypothetical protein V4596_01910 [Bdellovibrionota bacterium]
MKTILLALSVTVAVFTSTFAQAASVLVPSFKGKIHNYSTVPNDELEVSVRVQCDYKSGWPIPDNVSCGNQSAKIKVEADGTFVVPDLQWQNKKSLSYYRASFSVNANKANGTDGNFVFAAFSAKEIRKMAGSLVEMSIYEMPAIKINVVTPTGEDYKTWRGVVDYGNPEVQNTVPCVNVSMSIKTTKENLAVGNNWTASKGSNDSNTPELLSGSLLGVRGNPGADLKVVASLSSHSKMPECKSNSVTKSVELMKGLQETLSQVHKVLNNSVVKVD